MSVISISAYDIFDFLNIINDGIKDPNQNKRKSLELHKWILEAKRQDLCLQLDDILNLFCCRTNCISNSDNPNVCLFNTNESRVDKNKAFETSVGIRVVLLDQELFKTLNKARNNNTICLSLAMPCSPQDFFEQHTIIIKFRWYHNSRRLTILRFECWTNEFLGESDICFKNSNGVWSLLTVDERFIRARTKTFVGLDGFIIPWYLLGSLPYHVFLKSIDS